MDHFLDSRTEIHHIFVGKLKTPKIYSGINRPVAGPAINDDILKSVILNSLPLSSVFLHCVFTVYVHFTTYIALFPRKS